MSDKSNSFSDFENAKKVEQILGYAQKASFYLNFNYPKPLENDLKPHTDEIFKIVKLVNDIVGEGAKYDDIKEYKPQLSMQMSHIRNIVKNSKNGEATLNGLDKYIKEQMRRNRDFIEGRDPSDEGLKL